MASFSCCVVEGAFINSSALAGPLPLLALQKFLYAWPMSCRFTASLPAWMPCWMPPHARVRIANATSTMLLTDNDTFFMDRSFVREVNLEVPLVDLLATATFRLCRTVEFRDGHLLHVRIA